MSDQNEEAKKDIDFHNVPQSLDEVVEKAAQHLPSGYSADISITKHGYGVVLITPDCEEKQCDGGDGLISDVNEAICIAHGFAS